MTDTRNPFDVLNRIIDEQLVASGAAPAYCFGCRQVGPDHCPKHAPTKSN